MYIRTKILIIIFGLMSLSGFSQTNPKITLTGTSNQATIYKGAVGANMAMLLPEGTHEDIYPDLPKKGRIQLNSNTNKLEVHNGTEWVEVESGETGNLTADQVFENGSYVDVRESVNIRGGNDGFGGGSLNLRNNAAELHSPNFQYNILTTDTGCSFGSYNGTQRGALFANKDVVQAETYITNYPYTRIGWDLDRATNQFRVKTNGLPVVTFGPYGAKYDTTYMTYNFESDPNMIPSAGWVEQKIENALGVGGAVVVKDEGNGVGYVLSGRDDSIYDNVGKGAIEFTANDTVFNAGSVGSRGDYSFTAGIYCNAQNLGDFAAGYFTKATGSMSFSVGSANTSSGSYSFTAGAQNIASGTSDFVAGYSSSASGGNSMAVGYSVHAAGGGSQVLGAFNNSESFAHYSFLAGSHNTSYAGNSATFGTHNLSHAYGVTTVGYYADPIVNPQSVFEPVKGDPIFVVGNGNVNDSGVTHRKNAYVLFNDGTSVQTGVDNYASDLSSEFTENSKVSKKYVDNAIDEISTGSGSGEMEIYNYPDSLSFAKIKVKPYYDENEEGYQPGYFQYNTHHKLDDLNTTDTYLDIEWDRLRLGHSINYNDGEYSSSLRQEIDFNNENLHFEFANSESGVYQNMSIDGNWSISGYQSGGSYSIGVERQISGDYAGFRFPAPVNSANYYLPVKVNGQLADSRGEIDLTNSINTAVDNRMTATYNLLEDSDLAGLSIAVNTYISYLPATGSSRKLKLLEIGTSQGKRISIFNMSAHDLRLETAKGADDIWNSGISSSFFIVPPGANIVLVETGNKLAVETFKTAG